MKKYVKPVMESESFVANEYIGACWLMTCSCQGENDPIAISGNDVGGAIMGSFGNSLEVAGQETNGDLIVVGSLYGSSGESCNTAHSGLDTTLVDQIDCTKVNWGEGKLLCYLWTAFFGTGGTQVGEAHHHVTLASTTKANYPAHPNHS